MLTRIYVDNFRCFVNFDFYPGPKQLLMGRNGVGKSTLLEVLTILRSFSVDGQSAEDRLMGPTRTLWQDLPQQRFLLQVKSDNGEYTYELVVDEIGSLPRPRVVSEVVKLDGQPIFSFEKGEVHLYNDSYENKVHFGSDWHRSALASVAERRDNTKLTWFKRWLGGVSCLRIDPLRMSARAEKEAIEPDPDINNFASWYRHLVQEQTGTMGKLQEELRGVLSGFESLELKEAGQNTRVLRAEFRAHANGGAKGKPVPLDFDQLSDGQRAVVVLYTLLHTRKQGSLLCIDEPDNFVSIGEIQPWLYRLIDLAEEESTQFMLISHHPELLNQLATDCGVVFERPGFGPVTTAKFKGSPKSDLPPSEQIARGWNGE